MLSMILKYIGNDQKSDCFLNGSFEGEFGSWFSFFFIFLVFLVLKKSTCLDLIFIDSFAFHNCSFLHGINELLIQSLNFGRKKKINHSFESKQIPLRFSPFW